MKLINEKGKVMGWINLIDLMVLLVVVMAGIFVSRFYFHKEVVVTPVDNTSTIVITYYIHNVRDVSVEAIHEGDSVYEVNSKQSFGTVISKEVENAKIMTKDANGKIQYVDVPDRYDMYIKVETQGEVTEEAITLNNENIKIGYVHLVDLKNIRFEGVVFGLEY